MATVDKDETRVMGEKSIAKSFKGILRIAHILDLVQNEDDGLFNPTYYSRPKTLMNISGGAYESLETGYHNPLAGMDGTISRYSENNPKIEKDDLRLQRVPMCDSMGNYLNWNIGLDGVTIGSDENINSNAIDLESFKQNDIIASTVLSNQLIWQQKYFPILEAGEIHIGLNNKEYPSDKFKVNQTSQGLILQSSNENARLIIENMYDKSVVSEKDSVILDGKKFNMYESPKTPSKFRTIYSDNKSNVEEFDVFMYRQNDYDCHNYDYQLEGASTNDIKNRGNKDFIGSDKYSFGDNSVGTPVVKTIDSNVGIVNLKEYVFDMIEKYMKSAIVEVPTGTIINQYCSLDKWYAFPDQGIEDDLIEEQSYPGHRPAMMAKRDVGMMTNEVSGANSQNQFVQSTIMGASKKINKLINSNYDFAHHEENKNQSQQENWTDDGSINYAVEGYYKEIIPLYKRDYVLCDGSVYCVFLFPKNFATNSYPNRRDSLDRFIDLFFSIGYQYTVSNEYVNKRFKAEWSEVHNAYKILRQNAGDADIAAKKHFVTAENCLKLKDESGNVGDGAPLLDTYPVGFDSDRHSVFVEDFLTILAFEALYQKYGEASNVDFSWNLDNIINWIKNEPIPEKYRLQSFLGEMNSDITTSKYIDRTNNKDCISKAADGEFVMELPYYNFKYNHVGGTDKVQTGRTNSEIPLIALGREIKTFGDPIQYWDNKEEKWVIIEAYKLPQIQHFIDLFSVYPTPDSLAQILNTYHQYTFQVPNITGNIPTFIGSSGIQWADSQFNRLRTIESWSSSYAQKNYMHRHFVFVEPSKIDPASGDHDKTINGSFSETKNGVEKYKPSTATGNTTISSAACWGGEVICNCSPPITQSFEFGEGDNPNYIWNELGAGGAKSTNMTITNDSQVINGMRYPVLQTEGDTDNYRFWPTGDYRPTTSVDKPDLTVCATGSKTVNGENINYHDEIWDRDDIIDFGSDFINGKHTYDKNHWYGWEHYEDPRFDSLEPNRGRTSTPVNSSTNSKTICSIRYEKNEQHYNVTEETSGAEWFSPENIKMLPLIKL